jgi:hypothetical protein
MSIGNRLFSFMQPHKIQTLPGLYKKAVDEIFHPRPCYYFLGAFFLPATVLRLPFLVRLLVRVR